MNEQALDAQSLIAAWIRIRCVKISDPIRYFVPAPGSPETGNKRSELLATTVRVNRTIIAQNGRLTLRGYDMVTCT
ncbi:MAG: hypothetical protein FD165_1835 [Gammaproteobacteria bacterium]|nr:MAG: hypothetical protein FD165_1835 [Gammaproteobacteria bacterium]